MRIEQEFLSNDDLGNFIGMQKIFDYYKDHKDNLDTESQGTLYDLIAKEKERRFEEAMQKGMAAASVYNEVIKKKPGKDIKTLMPFIDEEVKRYINFLKLLRSKMT